MADDVVKVIGCIACHINNNDNDQILTLFSLCLRSILLQETRLDLLLISWSCEDKREQYLELLLSEYKTAFESKNIDFRILYHTTALTQFQHYSFIYQHLLEYIKEKVNNIWILFGDVDDIWDAHRVSFYKRHILLHTQEAEKVSVILPHWYFQCKTNEIPLEAPTEQALVDVWTNCSNVVRYHSDSTAPSSYRIRYTNVDNFDPDQGASFEYFQCCVKLLVLEHFFEQARDDHLQSMYCDIAFGHYIDSLNSDSKLVISHLYDKNIDSSDIENWLYCKVGQNHSVQYGITNSIEDTYNKKLSRTICAYFPESREEVLQHIDLDDLNDPMSDTCRAF